MLVAAYVLAAQMEPLGARFWLFDDGGLQSILVMVSVILFGMYLGHMYSDVRIRSRILLAQHITVLMGAIFLVQALFAYLNLPWILSQNVLLVGTALAGVGIFASRTAFSAAISNEIGSQRVLFVGFSPLVSEITTFLKQRPERGFEPVGYVNERSVSGSVLPWLQTPEGILETVEECRPDWVVVGDRDQITPQEVGSYIELRFGGMRVESVTNFYERVLARVCSARISPKSLLLGDALKPNLVGVQLQRIYTFVAAVATLPVMIPLGALTALVVRLGSGSPVLEREQRVGKDGVIFTSYRFRTTETGQPRFTSVGRFLRRFGLDGVPQIWNVLCGQMTFVGPDPDRPEFRKRLNEIMPLHAQRSNLAPGMTGWAQVQQLAAPERDALLRLEYDLYYLENLSPALDLFILLSWFRDTVLYRDMPQTGLRNASSQQDPQGAPSIIEAVSTSSEAVTLRELPDGAQQPASLQRSGQNEIWSADLPSPDLPGFPSGALVEIQSEQNICFGQVLNRQGRSLVIHVEHLLNRSVLEEIQQAWADH